jgi:hypothetical protein
VPRGEWINRVAATMCKCRIHANCTRWQFLVQGLEISVELEFSLKTEVQIEQFQVEFLQHAMRRRHIAQCIALGP